MEMQERRGARNEVDEQRGSECDARARANVKRGGTHGQESPMFPQGHLTFKWAGRSNARTTNTGFSRERERECIISA